MIKQNKPVKTKISSQMVDSAKLYTPSAYAKAKGYSRANLYDLIKRGSIPAERIVKINGAQLIIKTDAPDEA